MSEDIKRDGWGVAALLGCFLLAVPAEGASFDCGKAKDDIDVTICGNENLSRLDEKLSRLYNKAVIDSPYPEQLKKEQKVWLKIRNKACYLSGLSADSAISPLPMEDCLIDLYRDRVATLEYDESRTPSERKNAWANEGPLSMAAPLGSMPYMISPMNENYRNLGNGYAVCEALVRWINRNSQRMLCPVEAVTTVPGMQDVEWQALDAKMHEQIIIKLFTLAEIEKKAFGEGTGWGIYSKGVETNQWPNDINVQQISGWVHAQIVAGLKLSVFKGDMYMDLPEGLRTVSVLHIELPNTHCLWDVSKPASGYLAFVTADLKALDGEIYSQAPSSISPRILKRYKGNVFLINASESGQIGLERNVYGNEFCSIRKNPKHFEK